MIRTVDVKLNAAHPTLPLMPVETWIGSPVSLRIRGVPETIGRWRVETVSVVAAYPGGKNASVAAVDERGIFVATVEAPELPGSSMRGLMIVADGTDERGDPVTGYVLGVADILVLDRDGTITVGETTYNVHLVQVTPEHPHAGDLALDTLKLYDGEKWISLGARSGVAWNEITDKPTEFPPEAHTHAVADVAGLETALTKAVADAEEAKAAVIMKRDATDNKCHATTTVDEWTFTGGIHVGANYTVQIKSEGAGVLRKWYAWLYVNNFYVAKTEIENADVTSVDWDNREGGVIHGERKVTTYAKRDEYYLTKTYTEGLLDGIDEKLKKIDGKRDKTDSAEYAAVPVQRKWQHDSAGNAALDAFLDSRPLGGLVFVMESETIGYWVIDEADGWLTQSAGTVAVNSVDERLKVYNESSPSDVFTVHFHRESAYDGTRTEPTGDVMAARVADVAPGVAKFDAAGKLVAATPSSPSVPGDFRAPTDNICHKDEFSEWAFERVSGDVPPGKLSTIYDDSLGVWILELDGREEGAADCPGDEDSTELEWYDNDGKLYVTATRRVVAKSGESYATPSGVDETYIITDAVDGGVSVKINGETVTAYADLLAKCKTGRAVLYGQATTVETGYAFYTAASVTDSVIQFQVSGMLYDKNNIRYGMYVRRIKIVPRANGGLLVDDSGLEGPFAKKSDIPTDDEITGIAEDAVKAKLPYSLNSTGLKDRAFNSMSFDGTEFNLSTALAEVTPTAEGQPRDLLIVATATAATTISYTAGTIKGDKPTIDGVGTWLITLTEYAANTWYCRQIKMEDAA